MGVRWYQYMGYEGINIGSMRGCISMVRREEYCRVCGYISIITYIPNPTPRISKLSCLSIPYIPGYAYPDMHTRICIASYPCTKTNLAPQIPDTTIHIYIYLWQFNFLAHKGLQTARKPRSIVSTSPPYNLCRFPAVEVSVK